MARGSTVFDNYDVRWMRGGVVGVFWWKIIICAINKDLRDGDFGFED